MAEKAGFLSKVMPQGPEALGVLIRWSQVSPSDYTVRESSDTKGPKASYLPHIASRSSQCGAPK